MGRPRLFLIDQFHKACLIFYSIWQTGRNYFLTVYTYLQGKICREKSIYKYIMEYEILQ